MRNLRLFRPWPGVCTVQEPRVSLLIESRFDQVWLVRTAVRAWLMELGFDETACDEMQIAIAEAMNNAIEHGCGEEPGNVIELVLRRSADDLEVTIFNDIRTARAGALKTPEFCETYSVGERGRGLLILGQVMDSIVYGREDQRSYLRLTKKLPPLAA